jgi:integrase
MGSGLDARPVRRHVSGAKRTEVTNQVRELERQRDAGAVTASSRTTLAAWMAMWISKREALGSVRRRTLDGYRVDQHHIVAAIGTARLEGLRPAHVERLWEAMVAAGRAASIAHCRRTLMAALNEAASRGLLARNPVKLANTPKVESPEIEPYTVEQMCQLLDAARGTRNAPRWTLAAVLGLRQGEVLGLQWADLDLTAEGTVTVRRQLQRLGWQHACENPSDCRTVSGTKAKRGADCPQRAGGGLVLRPVKSTAGRRVLTLPPSLTAELRAHRRAQVAERLASEIWDEGPGGGWLFAHEAGGPLDPRADLRAFKELCIEAGLPSRRLHDLRHSAATMMLDSDLDLKTAGQVLGHSQLALTARYQHVLADRKSVAASRIEAAMFGRRKGLGHADRPSTAP